MIFTWPDYRRLAMVFVAVGAPLAGLFFWGWDPRLVILFLAAECMLFVVVETVGAGVTGLMEDAQASWRGKLLNGLLCAGLQFAGLAIATFGLLTLCAILTYPFNNWAVQHSMAVLGVDPKNWAIGALLWPWGGAWGLREVEPMLWPTLLVVAVLSVGDVTRRLVRYRREGEWQESEVPFVWLLTFLSFLFLSPVFSIMGKHFPSYPSILLSVVAVLIIKGVASLTVSVPQAAGTQQGNSQGDAPEAKRSRWLFAAGLVGFIAILGLVVAVVNDGEAIAEPDRCKPGQVVTLEDRGMELFLRASLKLSLDAPVSCEALQGIQRLVVVPHWDSSRRVPVASLEDLRHLTGLKDLILDVKEPVNPPSTMLASLPSLEKLMLGGPVVEDFNDLRLPAQLKDLTLADNGLSSIEFVGQLPRLEALTLSDNPLDDLRPVHGLLDLKKLSLTNLPLAPIEVLFSRLVYIQELHVSVDDLPALSSLKGAVALERLTVRVSPTTDFEDMPSFDALKRLRIIGAQASQIERLPPPPARRSVQLE